jgi:membrane-bound serine protease (ClpP class)
VGPSGGTVPVTDSKTINALTEFISVRAEAHGRNATIARMFITDNLNLDANDALAVGAIEWVANDTRDLLVQIDGTEVDTASGPYALSTANAELISVSPSARVAILRTLADPVIASILLFIGLYWLIFGLNSPGHGSEVAGSIFLIAGLVGLSALDVNLGGLILIGVGAALLLGELYSPGFGALGIGGFIAVVLGSLLLFSSGPIVIAEPDLFRLFLILIIAPIGFGAFFLFAAYKVIEVRRRKPIEWTLVGDVADAAEDLEPGIEGFVLYQGEYWKATTSGTVRKGQKVKIIAKEGPVLRVSPLTTSTLTETP